MSAGGDNGLIARVAGPQVQTPTTSPGAAYTPVQQGPIYQPQYQQYQPQARMSQPQQQQMPNYQSGLQAAMMHMMQQYSRPAMRAPLQQGLSPSSPMAYRPTMPTDNLRRVAPGVTREQMYPTPPPPADDGSYVTPDASAGGSGA